MKIFGFVAIVLVFFIAGYLLGSYKPINSIFIGKDSIKGSAELKVTVKDSLQKPVVDLEVDVASKNEPPTADGIKRTDINGVATFNLKPGHYFIFFNTINFPTNYQVPRETEIDVSEGQLNNKTIILQTKS